MYPCLPMPDCHTFVSYFRGFQMPTISRVFGHQLWNLAALLILTCSFSWWGSFLWLMKFNLCLQRILYHICFNPQVYQEHSSCQTETLPGKRENCNFISKATCGVFSNNNVRFSSLFQKHTAARFKNVWNCLQNLRLWARMMSGEKPCYQLRSLLKNNQKLSTDPRVEIWLAVLL